MSGVKHIFLLDYIYICMANNKLSIDPEKRYTAREAAPLLEITEATVKKKCREEDIQGIQVGTKNVWMIYGSEILEVRKRWKLD